MRKCIKKFKAWLIKKLGGYTLPTSEFKVYRPKPIELHATLTNVRKGYITEDDIEKHLVYMIAEEIKNNKLYDLKRGTDIMTGERAYKMNVLVVEPLNIQ